MKRCNVRLSLMLLLLPGAINASSVEGKIRLHVEGTNALVQVQGDEADDWRIQTSSDLVTWINLTALGTLLSGNTNAPPRSLGGQSDSRRFYRALRTAGLYDTTLLRTISLTFTQSNWQTLLANGRASGSNTLGNLAMDNGATNFGVGVRYKGNTSYTMSGVKKSVNIELDYTNATAALMGYETVNLNNAWGDETVMREPLYFNVMQNYTVCPKGSVVKQRIPDCVGRRRRRGDAWTSCQLQAVRVRRVAFPRRHRSKSERCA